MKEFELIKKIASAASQKTKNVPLAIGDDCAEFLASSSGASGRFIVTADALFEDVHFKKAFTSMRSLGRKSLAVNLSDIAAMGGTPLFHLITIGIPQGFGEKEIEEFFAGVEDVARDFCSTLVGGDTCKSRSGLNVSITAIGASPENGILKRSGAKPHDAVYVSGTLGTSALGLEFLGSKNRTEHAQFFIKRHNEVEPRVEFGKWLAETGCVSAAIDISDGLAQDAGHICEESGVGIDIFSSALPLDEKFVNAAAMIGKDPLRLAVCGGEDYEILFTVKSEKQSLFEKLLKVAAPSFKHRVTKIGEVTKGGGVTVFDMSGAAIQMDSGGFEHRF